MRLNKLLLNISCKTGFFFFFLQLIWGSHVFQIAGANETDQTSIMFQYTQTKKPLELAANFVEFVYLHYLKNSPKCSNPNFNHHLIQSCEMSISWVFCFCEGQIAFKKYRFITWNAFIQCFNPFLRGNYGNFKLYVYIFRCVNYLYVPEVLKVVS